MRPSCRFQPVVVLRSWFRSRSQCGTGRLGLLRMRRPITRRRFEAARVSLDTALHWEPQISYAGRSMDMIEFETKLRQSFSEGKDSITITFARDAFKGFNHAKTLFCCGRFTRFFVKRQATNSGHFLLRQKSERIPIVNGLQRGRIKLILQVMERNVKPVRT